LSKIILPFIKNIFYKSTFGTLFVDNIYRTFILKIKGNNMKQEDIDLLFKDICARLPYGVKVKFAGYSGREDCTLNAQHLGSTYNIEYLRMKPYLRPLSSMTEEEAKEVAILHDIKDILSVKVTNDYIDVIVDDGVCSTERRTIWYDEIISSIEVFDWLNAHHFDVRHLIEKNLAIEVTEENNPYKE
jgi:hypothetical protein